MDSTNPIDSCDGMSRVCDALGKGMLCQPDGWCYCYIAAQASPPPPRVVGKTGAARL
jgi:hypothetical protein